MGEARTRERKRNQREREGGGRGERAPRKGPRREERSVAQSPLQSESVLIAPGFRSRKNLQRRCVQYKRHSNSSPLGSHCGGFVYSLGSPEKQNEQVREVGR